VSGILVEWLRSYEDQRKGSEVKGKGKQNEKGKGRGNVAISDFHVKNFRWVRCEKRGTRARCRDLKSAESAANQWKMKLSWL